MRWLVEVWLWCGHVQNRSPTFSSFSLTCLMNFRQPCRHECQVGCLRSSLNDSHKCSAKHSQVLWLQKLSRCLVALTIRLILFQVGRFGHVANFTWLPNHHLRWYRNEVACLDRNSQASKVLPVLHAALQNFSATLEELRKPRQTLKRYEKNRDELMDRIAVQVKGVSWHNPQTGPSRWFTL